MANYSLFLLTFMLLTISQYECGVNRLNEEPILEESHTPSSCLLEHDSGFCYASFPRYYYDVTSNQCKEFIYGGCGGNSNNFRSLEECTSKCCITEPDNEINTID